MPQPKKRQSNSRSHSRTANWKVSAATIGKCANCGAAILSARICPECGTYKGLKLLPSRQEKIESRNAKRKAKDNSQAA
jgi:large subunit ribosomal protein L32